MKPSQTVTVFPGIIVAVIVVYVLKELRSIFVPLLLAMLLSFLFGPWVRKLVQKGVPLWLVLLVLVVVLCLLVPMLGTLIYSSAMSFADKFAGDYEPKLIGLFQDTLKTLSIKEQDVQNYVDKLNWNEVISKFSVPKILSKTLGSVVDFLVNILLVLVFMLFILAGWTRMQKRLGRAFDPERAKKISTMIDSIERRTQTYLLAKTVLSLGTALVAMGILLLFGVDFVIICGLLIFLLIYIPNIGSIIATIFPLLLCFLEFGLTWKLPMLLLCLISMHMLFGNILEPMMMGKGLDLSPLVVILSLVFWGWVWGIIGVVLAIPLTATVKIIFEGIESLRPIAVLMSQE
jgi:predicted PurR-regulated permease PerM